MNASDAPSEIGLSWQMRQHEARLLADSLRTSRLTLLYANAGPSRRDLLSQGVMALLGRRAQDLAVDGETPDSRVVAPFIDRRNAEPTAGEGGVQSERTVYFCDWSGDSLAALLGAIGGVARSESPASQPAHRLVDALEAACERLGARLLVILDDLEQLWCGDVDAAAVDRFIGALAEALDRPRLNVSFLLAVDDRWEARLDTLRRHIPGFDDSTVRLLGFERTAAVASARPARPVAPMNPVPEMAATPPLRVAEPPTLSNVVTIPDPVASRPTASASGRRSRRNRPPKVPLAPSVPIKAEGVYAFIESTLTQTADASEPWHDVAVEPPASEPVASDKRAAGGLAALAPDAREPVAASGSMPQRSAPSAVVPPQPPSPIDDWLDSTLAWCRRFWRSR